MIKLTVSFITGIAAFAYAPFFPGTIAFLFTLTLLLARRFSAVRSVMGEPGFPVFIIIIMFVFGFLYSSARHSALPELVLTKDDALVEGTVVGSPGVSGGTLIFTLDDNYLEGQRIEGQIRFYFLTGDKKVEHYEQSLSPGDRVSVLAKLHRPQTLRNPGVYAFNLKREGVAATGHVMQARVLSTGHGVMSRIYKVRQRLARLMDRSLSAESSALLKAIIPGFTGDLSRETRYDFSASGLAHLLSISGTHFGLLAFIVFKMVRFFVKLLPYPLLLRLSLYMTPTQTAVLATLPVLILYALISGGSTPTIRSLIMVSIYMFALMLGRKDQWLNSLSIAACIILLWNPQSIFQLSFLLSFLAVISIGYALELMQEQRGNSGHSTNNTGVRIAIMGVIDKLKTAPVMTVAAVIGTTPLVAAAFKHVPLISPVSNIIVTPIVCFLILPMGFLSGFFALAADMPVMPLNGVIDVSAAFSLGLIKMFSEVPYSSIHVHHPSPALTVMYYGALFMFAGAANANQRGGKPLVRGIPFLLVVALYLAGPSFSGGSFRVAFLDAGQGDASIVELPDGKVMLIDGSTVKPDMGRLAIAPYLWAEGIRKVDYVVLSHFHPDHYGGLLFLLEQFPVGEVWLSGRLTDDASEFLQLVNDKKIVCKVLGRGDVFKEDMYSVYVLHPYNEFNDASSRGAYASQNNGSLVLKIETRDASVLFTGDIEKEAEEDLLHLGSWLDSDILKVPHHGSRTSSSREFTKLVSPQIAVASSGMGNAFGHPHHDIIERYKDGGAAFFRTDFDGAVILSSDEGKYDVSTDRTRSFKKVSHWRDELRNVKLLLRIY